MSSSKKLLDTSFDKYYKEEITNAVIDNINLLYVAFTRAEEQLYVFTPADKGKDLNTTGKLINRVIQRNIGWKENSTEENNFSFGQSSSYVKKEKKRKDTGITLSSYPSNRWNDRISITSHAVDLIELLQSPGSSKINYGILVHKILSEINSKDEIEKTISKYYFEGLFSVEEKKNLEEKIRDLFLLPEVSYFFSNEWAVKSEREIILPGGEIVRPDRVLIKGNKAIIIDFKTGKELPSHEKQVTQYAGVLSLMNYTDIEKYLVYVNEKKVKRVN